MGLAKQCVAAVVVAVISGAPTLAQAPTPAAREQALAAAVNVAAHDAETMAVNSGQPSQFIVFEISKAVRDVVWSSGEAPSVIEESLKLAQATPHSHEADQALTLIEREMAE